MSDTGTNTQTGTITRADALIRQINLVVQSTTGSASFKSVIEKGIKNRWIRFVTINGLNNRKKICQQIKIEIDWEEHALRLRDVNNGQIKVNLASSERNWISQVIGNIIDGFNEIKETSELDAVWLVSYTSEAKSISSEVDRVLGLKTAEPEEWEDGRLESMVEGFRPKKLSEAAITWKVVTKPEY